MPNPKAFKEWKFLENFADTMKSSNLREQFSSDENRFSKFSRSACGLLYDFSKQRINANIFDSLISLANEMNLQDSIEKMFNGERINFTERRAVLHVALRNLDGEPIHFEGRNIMPDVKHALDKMKNFVTEIHSGARKGYNGKKIDTIVNVGIGGSDLGPAMVCNALKSFAVQNMSAHFVSNVDPNHIGETLKNLNPETTLFVISSKTFTTQETLANANAAKEWFISKSGEHDISKHFIAVSTNKKAVVEFGINPDNMFVFWDWVGGRFSLWSSIGISIALYIGIENFYQLLDGAREMDKHFRLAPMEQNLPVIMGLMGIWNINFLGFNSLAVIPYNQYLELFPSYLQQAEMESNGKQATRDGVLVDYATSPAVWGQVGTNGQHAFFQMLHQGSQIIPIDFIAAIDSLNPNGDMQKILLANMLAQAEGLAFGKNAGEVMLEMRAEGVNDYDIQELLPHKVFHGNRPSSVLLMNNLSPHSLGALIALYEHKIFVQGVVWNINSFDQWGVELGKRLAKPILSELISQEAPLEHDSSTNSLINIIRIKSNNK